MNNVMCFISHYLPLEIRYIYKMLHGLSIYPLQTNLYLLIMYCTCHCVLVKKFLKITYYIHYFKTIILDVERQFLH